MKSLLMLALLVQATDGGVIAGRLLTPEGKPAANVRVAASAIAAPGDANGGALLAISETDKDGMYRLEKVPAGRYFITAGLVSAPSYYPGTGSASKAKEIQVLAGTTLEKMDFAIAIPDGVTVSGRLAMAPSISPTNKIVFISQAPGIVREETLRPDGTFEFTKVSPGLYMIAIGFGIPNQLLTVADRDIAGLVVGPANGVRIVGKLKINGIDTNSMPAIDIVLSSPTNSNAMVLSTPPPVGGGVSSVVSSGQISTSQNFSTRNNSDGSFEFIGVPPGSYLLRALPPGPPTTSTTLTIADKDVMGIELAVPFFAELPGKIVLADGAKFPAGIKGISLEARYSNGSMGTSPAADGSFRLHLSQGDFQIRLRNLPLGFKVDSVKVKGVDAPNNVVHIAPGQPIDETILILTSIPLDAIKGVRVSGRVTGMPNGNYAGGSLTLSGADASSNTISTLLHPDGTFEFAKVPAGTYTSRVEGISGINSLGSRPVSIVVGNDDISGFQIPLNIRIAVVGKITVVDQDGKTRTDVIPSGQVTFRRLNGSTGSNLRPDGTFQVPIELGEQTITIDRLPSQFTIQSITSGAVDLMKSPLKAEFNAPPAEIQVRMLYRP